MFVSRTNELGTLNRMHSKGTFQMAVVYGRRRVGKTALLSEFVKDKPAIMFTAYEANERLNLELFSAAACQFFKLPKSAGEFRNWHDAFSLLPKKL
jgi:AAA+ ATPase superfamily predicted ATPase